MQASLSVSLALAMGRTADTSRHPCRLPTHLRSFPYRIKPRAGTSRPRRFTTKITWAVKVKAKVRGAAAAAAGVLYQSSITPTLSSRALQAHSLKRLKDSRASYPCLLRPSPSRPGPPRQSSELPRPPRPFPSQTPRPMLMLMLELRSWAGALPYTCSWRLHSRSDRYFQTRARTARRYSMDRWTMITTTTIVKSTIRRQAVTRRVR